MSIEDGKIMTDIQKQIDGFLAGERYAVVGASTNRSKYGNKVLRAYGQAGKTAYPVNPSATEIEGLQSYPDLASLPSEVDGISIITPPAITAQVIDAAIEAGIPRIWIQPGAENAEAIERARAKGIDVIADGPCLLVAVGYRETAD